MQASSDLSIRYTHWQMRGFKQILFHHCWLFAWFWTPKNKYLNKQNAGGTKNILVKYDLLEKRAQFRYMGHSPCAYFRLFSLSQGKTAILGRSARFAISAFFSITEHKHHPKICMETLSILISIHFISKHEESQRILRFYLRRNKWATSSFKKWMFIVDPQWIFLRQKYQTPFSIMNFTSKEEVVHLLCRK